LEFLLLRDLSKYFPNIWLSPAAVADIITWAAAVELVDTVLEVPFF
jgi:hypothetical protein